MLIRRTLVCLTLAISLAMQPLLAAAAGAGNSLSPLADDCVVLLHGLARTSRSMATMEAALETVGYRVVNLDYPSRERPIEQLADQAIKSGLEICDRAKPAAQIHFVTHSMGGILVRYYLSVNQIDRLGRVVMLSPPNQGSETVDKLGNMPGFWWLNGPAGQQLGTDNASVPNRLGPARFQLGIITGDRSINLILSALIPGPDDGKVAIERARLEGMSDFLVVHHSHPFIMKKRRVIEQTLHFLRHARFVVENEA